MKCPNCKARSSVEINLHSDGFSPEESPVKECGNCGNVWRVVSGLEMGTTVDIIVEGKK